jgi:crossover junction endodeoxyribonuclease RuvC
VLYLGIDPGKSGAIAALNDDGNIVDVFKGSETEHDIANWLRATILAPGAKAVIEHVGAMPHDRRGAAFKFGQSYGFLRGLVVAYQIQFAEARPQKWQKAMECMTGGDKNVSKAAAQRLWPTFKITHANADALLIAEFCRRTCKEHL